MEFVQVEERGQVALVTVTRPKALNALNSQVMAEVREAFESIDVDRVRCVVITGAGEKSFIAGADIGEMRDLDEAQGCAWGEVGNSLMRMIEQFPLPVIAAVNGFALGGGNELAMSCDIRLASENAVFGQPEVGLGITPGFGGTLRLARVIGSVSKAKELLYTANTIKADEALRLGLVSAVYPQEELLPAAFRMAEKIAANAPVAVRNTKKAVNDGLDVGMDEAIKIEVAMFGNCFSTEDQVEGMSAFLEKRKEKTFRNR
ncbi:MAG: enoyl-CoA hydratase-related protein [Ndongobacter sp.]|nr:enoyl-CoA hydratase-related protein [Ndongobacter sp.]